jgi:hypothetical protein
MIQLIFHIFFIMIKYAKICSGISLKAWIFKECVNYKPETKIIKKNFFPG